MHRKARIVFNGLGRIGRHVFRALFDSPSYYMVAGVMIPELKLRDRAQELRADQYYGSWNNHIIIADEKNQGLVIDGTFVPFFICGDARFGELDADILVECSGALEFRKNSERLRELSKCARKTIVTYPCDGADIIIVYGVNHKDYISSHRIISGASCTTNCIAPILSVFLRGNTPRLVECSGTTVHAATSSQEATKILGQIADYTTGASEAVEKVLPALSGKTDFSSFRVSVAQVSCVELNCLFTETPSVQEVNYALDRASNSNLADIMSMVSVPKKKDFSGSYLKKPYSAIVNSESITKASNGSLIKIHAWYDNEWAYSQRIYDIIHFISQREKFVCVGAEEDEEFIPEYIPRLQDS